MRHECDGGSEEASEIKGHRDRSRFSESHLNCCPNRQRVAIARKLTTAGEQLVKTMRLILREMRNNLLGLSCPSSKIPSIDLTPGISHRTLMRETKYLPRSQMVPQ
jgi:hypothetical protein